jgi:RNA polymerase sigma-70 factor (ECF subfamily)
MTLKNVAAPHVSDVLGHRCAAELGEHLQAAASGDTEAFAHVYDAVAPRVFGLASKILRDTHQAEEVTQEVMLQLWQRAGDFDPGRGSAISWVMTMAHRRTVDRVRSSEAQRRRDVTHAEESWLAPIDETATAVQTSLDAQAVRTALAALSAPQREAIQLAYLGGYTHHEVAQLMQAPLGTTKTRIRDGLLRLRAALAPGTVGLV